MLILLFVYFLCIGIQLSTVNKNKYVFLSFVLSGS